MTVNVGISILLHYFSLSEISIQHNLKFLNGSGGVQGFCRIMKWVHTLGMHNMIKYENNTIFAFLRNSTILYCFCGTSSV